MNPRVKSVKPTDDYQLILEFTNGECGLYDCKPLLNFGVFKELQEITYFKQVSVIDGTVTWINEQDICPDTLYLECVMIDKIITTIWNDLINEINKGKSCSSEKALVFNFAWKLKEIFQENIELDFETTPFVDENNEKFSDGKFLDLYAKLNNIKIGFEFKFPKSSDDQKKIRIKIINDVKRLCWLRNNTEVTKRIDKGYFLCATNKMPYINKGKKSEAICFETYQGSTYMTGSIFPQYKKLSDEIIRIPKNIFFNWNGIKFDTQKNEYILLMEEKKYYAWLDPIII